MSERIHKGPIDEAAVLAWGYDEELLFNEEEDLVLGACVEIYPALARLAKDSACPKADYCLTIMDFSLMFSVLRQNPGAAERIHGVLSLLEGSSRPAIKKFVDVNMLRLALMQASPNPPRDRVLELGTAALNGVSRNAEISLTEDTDNWTVELSVPPFHLHKEWLRISKRTGEYRFEC